MRNPQIPKAIFPLNPPSILYLLLASSPMTISTVKNSVTHPANHCVPRRLLSAFRFLKCSVSIASMSSIGRSIEVSAACAAMLSGALGAAVAFSSTEASAAELSPPERFPAALTSPLEDAAETPESSSVQSSATLPTPNIRSTESGNARLASERKAGPSKYVRRSADADPLRFGISLYHASRIAFAGGERIESAVWDQQDLDLKTDSGSGQIFVRPKREGEIIVYVTTEAGDTVAIVLDAGRDKSPQNILLERTTPKGNELQLKTNGVNGGITLGVPMTGEDPRSASMLAPSPAPDFVAALKRFARHITLDREAADIMKRSSCPKPTASLSSALQKLERLKPVVESCWTTRDLRTCSYSRVRTYGTDRSCHSDREDAAATGRRHVAHLRGGART